MTKYLNATNDLAFKKIFSDDSRLISLLNSIMNLPDHLKILEIEYIGTEQVPDLGQLKMGLLDIRCKDASGNIYIVEMQNGYAPSFLKRVQTYGSRAVVNQVKRGRSYAELAPVVLVSILKSFKALSDEDLDVVTFHRNVEVKTGKSYLTDLSYVFVELDRFKKKEDELKTDEDQWLHFLANSDIVQKPPNSLQDDHILSAYETVNEFNWNETELDNYFSARLNRESQQLNMEEKYQKGKAEGKAERDIEIAKKLLNKGTSVGTISEITDLSINEIKLLIGQGK